MLMRQRMNLMLPVCGVGQHSQNVLLRQFGEIVQDFLLRHADRQHGQDVIDGNSQWRHFIPGHLASV